MTDQQAPIGLRTLTFGALMNQRFEPREPLLTPWLRCGQSAMLWAPSGAGKTLLSLTMALAVAGGGEFIGWRSPRPRRVLLVDGEMHMEDLRDRLALLAPSVDGIDLEAAQANLMILPRLGQHSGASFPDLGDTKEHGGQDALLAEVKRHKPDLVILDNLSTLTNLEDENAAAGFAPVSDLLLELRRQQVGVMLVHHSAKGGSNYRGSSRMEATFDVVVGLTVDRERDASRGARFKLVWSKYRGAPHAAVRERTVRLGRREDGKAEWQDEKAVPEGVRVVVKAVRSGRYSSQKAVAEALGLSEGEVSKRRKEAVRAGAVTEDEWKTFLGASRACGDGADETRDGARINEDF